jgi:hypothetical protein
MSNITLYPMLLTRTERDFLLGKREFSKGYSYTTKSRPLKKLELFINQELPILIEKDYLTADCKVSNRDLTAGCKVRDSVVRISQRRLVVYESEKKKMAGSEGFDPSICGSPHHTARLAAVPKTAAIS